MVGLAAKPNEDRPLAGILLMLAAYFLFSCIDTSSKWLGTFGIAALQLAFMRYFGALVIMTAIVNKNGIKSEIYKSDQLGLVIIRGFLLAVSTGMNFVALQYLPLTLTSTILFSAPIIVCALSWPLLGERVGTWRWLAIFIGFIGIIVAIRPFHDDFHPAAFLALGAAVTFALYVILTRKLSAVVAENTLQFYTALVGTLIMLPFAVTAWQNPTTEFQWLLMGLLGVFGWLGHGLLIKAHGFATPSMLSPFSYSFIVYLTIWSFFIFDHVPDEWTVIGAGIVVVAGLIIWYRERYARWKTPAQKKRRGFP